MAKSKPHIEIEVPVRFSGTVKVSLPASVPAKMRQALATKLALVRVVATTDNPDAPEGDACDEFAEEFALTEKRAGKLWDSGKTVSVGGTWKTGKIGDGVAAAE